MADYAIHDTTLIGTSNVIRKKEGSSALIDPADYPKRINLMGLLEEKTASGSIVTFSDGADDVPAKSLKVTIPPTLSGVSSVVVKQSGINYIQDADIVQGSFNSSGADVNTVTTRIRTNNYIPLTAGTYKIENKEGYQYVVYVYSTNSSSGYISGESLTSWQTYGTTFTLANDRYVRIGWRKSNNADILPSEIHDYILYNTTTFAQYTANLGRTIYGGTADVVNGEGKDNCKKIALGDLTWIKSGTEGNFYCSQVTDIWYPSEGGISRYGIGVSDEFEFVQGAPTDGQINCYFNTAYSGYRIFIKKEDYADRTSAEFKEYLQNINAHLVYKVNEATETDFTFSPVEISSRLGANTMWSDGDMSMTYRASGTITPVVPTLISKTITANGTYTASDDGVDGYDEVVVNVASPEPTVTPLNSPNAFMTISGITGTDVTRVARTITAPSDGKYVFSSDSTCMTNTGSGDGFIDIQKNDVSVVKQYMSANTTTAITIPDIDVEAGDEVDIVVGFDNAHSSCNFQLYTGIALVSEASTPSLLSMMPSEEIENTEEVEENEQNDIEG